MYIKDRCYPCIHKTWSAAVQSELKATRFVVPFSFNEFKWDPLGLCDSSTESLSVNLLSVKRAAERQQEAVVPSARAAKGERMLVGFPETGWENRANASDL